MYTCSVSSLPEKTTIYSTLIGLLNAKKYDFGEEVSVSQRVNFITVAVHMMIQVLFVLSVSS